MKHFIYETRCLATGKFYRGKHSTTDVDDGYLGSGVWIRRGVKAHGTDRYERTILEFCSKDLLDERETHWIGQVLGTTGCMNLKHGGTGGDTGNGFGSTQFKERLKDTEWTSSRSLKAIATRRERYGEISSPGFTGKEHSNDTKARIANTLKISDEILESRIKILKDSDYPKRGSIAKLAILWGVTHVQAGRFIKKYNLNK